MEQDQILAEKIVSSVKNDTRSGATELTQDALNHLDSFATSLNKLSACQSKISLLGLASRLSCLRPSMAPLQNVLEEWRKEVDSIYTSSNEILIKQVKTLCKRLLIDIHVRQSSQISHATKILANAQVILTISRSSVVHEIFKKLPQKPLRFIVCESRPGCEGRILATELAALEIIVDYIVDAAGGLYMPQADAVVVGADAILANGSVVNKCGTSLLALAAQHFKVPFYVVADSSKCTRAVSADFILEELPVAELNAPTSPYIHPHNIYFDVSPVENITAYITEYGIQKHWPWSNMVSS